jgi:hypothetical protein
MSREQSAMFWRLWASVMKVQGWQPAEANDRRHEVLESLGFKSIKDVGMTSDFDRLKKRLLELSDQVLNEQPDRESFVHGKDGELRNDTEGQRRRYLHRIGEQQSELAHLMGDEEAAAYLAPILQERFRRTVGWNSIGDLPTHDLEKMVMTLDRCVRGRREAAQDEHDLGKAMEIEDDLADGSMIAKEEGFSALDEEPVNMEKPF